MTQSSVSNLLIVACYSFFSVGCESDLDVPATVVEDSELWLASGDVRAATTDLAEYSVGSLRADAENNQSEVQLELARRLLWGEGMPANPAESIRWARRAAMNGEELAALWTGRAALNEPVDRIEASAWFLIALEAQEAAVREDASSELSALDLQEDERSRALMRAAVLRQLIQARSEESGYF